MCICVSKAGKMRVYFVRVSVGNGGLVQAREVSVCVCVRLSAVEGGSGGQIESSLLERGTMRPQPSLQSFFSLFYLVFSDLYLLIFSFFPLTQYSVLRYWHIFVCYF